MIHCHDKEYEAQTIQRGDFWVLKNYVRADHGELRCFETITYTTHADYTFLDNLIPLLERYVQPNDHVTNLFPMRRCPLIK